MLSYYVAQGNDYPMVNFDTVRREFVICGISHPESAMDFYGSLIRCLKDYVDEQHSTPDVVRAPLYLKLMFRHVNSMSFRSVSRICRLFSGLSDLYPCEIIWYFENEDVDIYEAGMDLKEELALQDTVFKIEETSDTIEEVQEKQQPRN